MATQYPTEREEHSHELRRLEEKIKKLANRNRKLNIALMRQSAKASEAREELERCKLEWKLVADQKGHNPCHAAVSRALKRTIGYTGIYPDPDNVNGEQFAHGCVAYHGDMFPNCGFKLKVVRADKG